MQRTFRRFLAPLAVAVILAPPASAQFGGITLPPSGNNQYSSITQGIGPVRVTVVYNSPDVHNPQGEDRRGKIWGALVPYGMADLGFGTCGKECPWRGGANENTVFTVSHDVTVEGQPLPAGSYGLHFIPAADEWTVIFSKNHTSWGSYFYDAKEDALRVKVKPSKSEYNEWLTYEFNDREADRATVALKWEDLQVPFTVAVPNVADLYFDQIRRELRSSPGFSWQNWSAAAQYALETQKNLDEGLRWAQRASDPQVGGQESFATLSTLSALQAANGKADDARKTMERAIALPGTSAGEIHQFGRQLQAQGKNDEAMKVFEANAKKFPNQWPVNVGLARGHMGLGHKQEALAAARAAKAQAPDDTARRNLDTLIQQIEAMK